MFKVTPELKAHMVKNFSVAEDAADDVVRKAVADAIAEGTLELNKVQELTAAKSANAETKIKDIVNEAIAEALKSFQAAAKTEVETVEKKAAPEAKSGLGEKAYSNAGDDDADRIRVKSVIERFSDSRTAATWDKSKNELLAKRFGGRSITSHINGSGSGEIDMPTDRSKAIAGAWFKHRVNKLYKSCGADVPWQFKMSEQDDMLVKYALHECKWLGPIGYHGSESADHWCEGEKLTDVWQKAVLDDSTSGGLEAVPIEFDAAVILTPLLEGELFPLVDITNVSRRRIEATKIGNPTVGWGVGEGTSIDLFDTDSFISAFDNNIYPLSGAMEVGKDLQSDSPLNIGGIIVNRYGARFRSEMDNVVANGNGTDRPTGIFQTSGVSSIGTTNGGSGPATIGDYEALMFGVAKEFRQEAGNRCVFLSTDTTYKRARAIPVDSDNDARRLFGLNELSYMLFDHPFRINGSAGNGSVAFVCMNRYRMYRRVGLEINFATNDRESLRRNTDLIVIRARFGGGLDHASAMSKHTDAQS